MNKKIVKKLGYKKEVSRIEAGLCPLCGEKIGKFKNKSSEKEYKISGMCQSCQSITFDGLSAEIMRRARKNLIGEIKSLIIGEEIDGSKSH